MKHTKAFAQPADTEAAWEPFAMNACMISETDSIDRYLDGIDHLPPTPALLVKLIELFRSPDRDTDEIIGLLRQDPPITAELLRRCNSAFFSGDEPVVDVRQAVFRLGFHESYRVSVSLWGSMALKPNSASGVDVEQLWQHSATTAIIASTLARELGESEGTAFTAGLLHDIGKIVIGRTEGAKYAEWMSQQGGCDDSLEAREKSTFGFCHSEVGARLLQRWGVASQICIPVLGHHQSAWPEALEQPCAILNLANQLAHWIRNNPETKAFPVTKAGPALELLAVTDEELGRLERLARADVSRLLSYYATRMAR